MTNPNSDDKILQKLALNLICNEKVYNLNLSSSIFVEYVFDTFVLQSIDINSCKIEITVYNQNNLFIQSKLQCLVRKIDISYLSLNRFILYPIQKNNIEDQSVHIHSIKDGYIVITILQTIIDIRGFFITDNDYKTELAYFSSDNNLESKCNNLVKILSRLNSNNSNTYNTLCNKIKYLDTKSLIYKAPINQKQIESTLLKWSSSFILHPKLEANTYKEFYLCYINNDKESFYSFYHTYRILTDSSDNIYAIARICEILSPFAKDFRESIPFIEFLTVNPHYLYRYGIGSEILKYIIAEIGSTILIESYIETQGFFNKFGFKKMLSNSLIDTDYLLGKNLVSDKKIYIVKASVPKENKGSYSGFSIVVSSDTEIKNSYIILERAKYLFNKAKYYDIKFQGTSYRLFDDGRFMTADEFRQLKENNQL